MFKNRTLKISLSLLLILGLNNTLLAKEKKANAEIGWRFGNFDEVNSTVKRDEKKSINRLLAEMLKTQKEQLKTQKKILKVLEDAYDPKPKTIIVDGKPCIANSSAKCYKWLPVPEAKRYPVIAQFFGNPTIKTAAIYLQWYSKHVNNALAAGTALYMAKNQYGENATNFALRRTSQMHPFGEFSSNLKSYLEKVIKDNMDKFYLNIYIGRSLEADTYGLQGVYQILKQYPNVNFNIIYYNSDVKTKIALLGKKLYYIKDILKKSKNRKFVGDQYFKSAGIYTTPSIEVILKQDKSAQIITVGKASLTNFTAKLIKYLKLKKVIVENEIDYKTWDDSKYIKHNLQREYGVDLNVSKYNYKNTNMFPKKPKSK